MYVEFGNRFVRRSASRCRFELIDVVIKTFGSGGGGLSVDGNKDGNLAVSAAGARERFVEVVERVGDVARGFAADKERSWDFEGSTASASA